MNTPIVNIALDKSYKIKKGDHIGKYHAKIWVTFIKLLPDGKKQWDQQPYKTGKFCSVEEFASMMDNDPKKRSRVYELKEIREYLEGEKRRAEDIIKNYNIVTQKKFDLYFLSDLKPETLAGQFQLKINELRSAKPKPKLSSAEKYETALSSLQKYFGDDVSFHQLTAEALQEYEDWYIDQDSGKKKKSGKKKSLTSVGINMRCLRHIFKRSIRQSVIPATLYPFGIGEDQYSIPEGGGDEIKKYLTTEQKNEFLEYRFIGYQCDNPKCNFFARRKHKVYPKCQWCRRGTLHQVDDDRFNELRDYAEFSYFGHGMNPSDIFRLQRSKVQGDHIIFNRQKTKGKKKKKNKVTKVPLNDRMCQIVRRRGAKLIGHDDPFVFPVLSLDMTEEQRYKKIKLVVSEMDDMLAQMASALKWDIKPTAYTIRHTFSDQYMQMGATTEQLQDALAHGSIQTTENYKHGFRLEVQKKLQKGL